MKYYGDGAYDIDTVYTRFGKAIAEIMEDPIARSNHPVLSRVPAYSHPEFELRTDVDDVPVLGFVDSFNIPSHAILEYKTGIRRTDGTAPWDTVKVHKHRQLPLYALLTRLQCGFYDPLVKLVWLETCWKEMPHGLSNGPDLALTGHIQVFERHIEEWELDWMRNEIIRIATEISEDYTRYQAHSSTPVDISS